jgi:hypothetical protein
LTLAGSGVAFFNGRVDERYCSLVLATAHFGSFSYRRGEREASFGMASEIQIVAAIVMVTGE